ncbi:MAG: AAA family ATPase, partial [Terrimicrobiaceae bacterium]|nr:AAA family ATPase [Terrimicrobiaceae bacterium]
LSPAIKRRLERLVTMLREPEIVEQYGVRLPRGAVFYGPAGTGKTTMALGLHGALASRFPRLGFIKPVGQRFVEVEGRRIDEDSVLIQRTFQTAVPIEDMSPIAVEPDFTRRYIAQSNHEALVRRIRHAFDRAAWEKDFVIIEGTGHAGVGSVFDLSNAKVASLLASKVLLVVPGGIGRPIDEAALNKALFDKEGVEVLGVVMNKLLPSKMEKISEEARRGFARLGIELFGVLPRVDILTQPTLRQVCNHIHGQFLAGDGNDRAKVAEVLIGAMSASRLFDGVEPSTLLVVPGDREDILLAAASRQDPPFCAVVLSDDLLPGQAVMDILVASGLPLISCRLDSYTISSRIHSMTVKTLPGDDQKIASIQELIRRHVDVPRLLEATRLELDHLKQLETDLEFAASWPEIDEVQQALQLSLIHI